MNTQAFLLKKIGEWADEGLISREQAGVLERRETSEAAGTASGRHVQVQDIFVYLGCLTVFLAMASIVAMNWQALGGTGRMLSVLAPPIAMAGLGSWLRDSQRARLRVSVQPLWLGACLLSGLFVFVALKEVDLVGEEVLWILVSCLSATVASGVAFVLLPSITQSVGLHACGTATLLALIGWFDHVLPPSTPFGENLFVLTNCSVVGGLWLVLAWQLRARDKKSPGEVSRIFGALTILCCTCLLTLDAERFPEFWQEMTLQGIGLVACIAFIVASAILQSRTFLYSGGISLLIWILANLERFTETIGMAGGLLVVGALFIGVGLGIGRLRKRIQAPR